MIIPSEFRNGKKRTTNAASLTKISRMGIPLENTKDVEKPGNKIENGNGKTEDIEAVAKKSHKTRFV